MSRPLAVNRRSCVKERSLYRVAICYVCIDRATALATMAAEEAAGSNVVGVICSDCCDAFSLDSVRSTSLYLRLAS